MSPARQSSSTAACSARCSSSGSLPLTGPSRGHRGGARRAGRARAPPRSVQRLPAAARQGTPGRAARARARRPRPDRARRHLFRRRVRTPREHARVALPVHPLRRDARARKPHRPARCERQRPAPSRPPRDVDLAACRSGGRTANARLQGRRAPGRRRRRRSRGRQPRRREAAADRRDRLGERHEDAHDLRAARPSRVCTLVRP